MRRAWNCHWLQHMSFAFIILLLTTGCIYRFANGERLGTHQPRTLYIAPVRDNTPHAGQSAPLMAALRRMLTQNRSFILTDIKTARWGLDVQILDSRRSITRVEKCDQGNEVLAAGSLPCSQVTADGKLPDVSAEDEVAVMSVEARAVDLRTGAVLFQTRLTDLSTGAYHIVGDGSVRASLSNARGLHVLRSMENSQTATESLANVAAARIYDHLLAVPPPSPQL